MAEAVRFELTVGFPTPVFKTGTLNHSVTLPFHFQKIILLIASPIFIVAWYEPINSNTAAIAKTKYPCATFDISSPRVKYMSISIIVQATNQTGIHKLEILLTLTLPLSMDHRDTDRGIPYLTLP